MINQPHILRIPAFVFGKAPDFSYRAIANLPPAPMGRRGAKGAAGGRKLASERRIGRQWGYPHAQSEAGGGRRVRDPGALQEGQLKKLARGAARKPGGGWLHLLARYWVAPGSGARRLSGRGPDMAAPWYSARLRACAESCRLDMILSGARGDLTSRRRTEGTEVRLQEEQQRN